MKRLTVRQFRSTFTQLEEPVEVGEGLWLPDRSKAAEVLRELGGRPKYEKSPVMETSVIGDAAEQTRIAREGILARQAARDAVLRKMPATKRPGR